MELDARAGDYSWGWHGGRGHTHNILWSALFRWFMQIPAQENLDVPAQVESVEAADFRRSFT